MIKKIFLCFFVIMDMKFVENGAKVEIKKDDGLDNKEEV